VQIIALFANKLLYFSMKKKFFDRTWAAEYLSGLLHAEGGGGAHNRYINFLAGNDK
jgi:hypothetical protein